MRWYHKLYEGEKAKEKRYSIIRKVWERKLQISGYVITVPSNGNNVLDIYPAYVLLLPYYKESDILIVGIAADYSEAVEVAGKIVVDMYREIGKPDIREFLKARENKEGSSFC